MARKWKTAIVIWVGVFLYFGIGSLYPEDADLFLIALQWVFLLAAAIYIVLIWVRDRAKGGPEKTYHLSAYPRRFLRFALDEEEPRREGRVSRQSRRE